MRLTTSPLEGFLLLHKKESAVSSQSAQKPQSAEEKFLAAYLKSLAKRGSEKNSKYESNYFDKPSDHSDENDETGEDDDVDAFDVRSCSPACCDTDCECDDCVRCSNSGLGEGELIASHGDAG